MSPVSESKPSLTEIKRAVEYLGMDNWPEGDKLRLENAILKERMKKMEGLIKSVFPKCGTCGKPAHNYVEDNGAFCNYDCWCKANGAEESDPSDIETMENWAEIEKLLEGKK